MKQSEGFEVEEKKGYICKFNYSLYGLKIFPRQWNKCFDEFIVKIGFEHSKYDACFYFKFLVEGNFIVLLLDVNDILIVNLRLKKL